MSTNFMKKLLLLLVFAFLCSCKGNPKIIWSFKTGGMVYGCPSIFGDRVIVTSDDHHVYALDHKSGKQVWKTALIDRIVSTPLIEKNAIYVGDMSGFFFALNAQTGKIIWKFKGQGGIENYKACADGTGIYFGSDFHFYKLNYAGQMIWDFPTKHQIWGGCVFYKDLVITSCWDSNFYGLVRATGMKKWGVSSGLINYGGPVLHQDSVFFGTHDKLYRIEAGSGRVLNLVKTTYLDNPVVYDGYLWTNEGGIKKRDLQGNIIKSVEFPATHMMKPVAVNGYLIQSTLKNELVGISKELEILWKHKGKDLFWSSGVVHNGVYYTGNRDGYVYAFSLPE